jgi:hypothetical protein
MRHDRNMQYFLFHAFISARSELYFSEYIMVIAIKKSNFKRFVSSVPLYLPMCRPRLLYFYLNVLLSSCIHVQPTLRTVDQYDL